MEVYHGPHLIIEYEKENSRLINTWKSNPSNDVVYREELLEYLEISKKIKPCQLLNFTQTKEFFKKQQTYLVNQQMRKRIHHSFTSMMMEQWRRK